MRIEWTERQKIAQITIKSSGTWNMRSFLSDCTHVSVKFEDDSNKVSPGLNTRHTPLIVNACEKRVLFMCF